MRFFLVLLLSVLFSTNSFSRDKSEDFQQQLDDLRKSRANQAAAIDDLSTELQVVSGDIDSTKHWTKQELEKIRIELNKLREELAKIKSKGGGCFRWRE